MCKKGTIDNKIDTHKYFTPVDGSWSNWSEYTACSVTCGDGVSVRTRTCSNPAPAHGGRSCDGEAREEKKCNMPPCAGECIL